MMSTEAHPSRVCVERRDRWRDSGVRPTEEVLVEIDRQGEGGIGPLHHAVTRVFDSARADNPQACVRDSCPWRGTGVCLNSTTRRTHRVGLEQRTKSAARASASWDR
jgi:hypothetical protein